MSLLTSEVEWLVARLREKLSGLSPEVESYFTTALDKAKAEEAALAATVKAEVDHLVSMGYTVTPPAPVASAAPVVDQPATA